MDAGRCLHTSLEVRPGQVVKYPSYMALHQVSMTGLKQALCRNCTRADSVPMWYALLAKTYAWEFVWAALVSATVSGWKGVGRGEGFELRYPCRGIK